MAVQSQCQASRTGDRRLADLNPDEAVGSCPIRNWVQKTLAFARCRIPFPGSNVIRLWTSCVIRMHFLREAIDHEIPRQDFTQQIWIGLIQLFAEPSASTASVPSRSSRSRGPLGVEKHCGRLPWILLSTSHAPSHIAQVESTSEHDVMSISWRL
jgi:hypothetical protein